MKVAQFVHGNLIVDDTQSGTNHYLDFTVANEYGSQLLPREEVQRLQIALEVWLQRYPK